MWTNFFFAYFREPQKKQKKNKKTNIKPTHKWKALRYIEGRETISVARFYLFDAYCFHSHLLQVDPVLGK